LGYQEDKKFEIIPNTSFFDQKKLCMDTISIDDIF
jgi:hypothetical protein